VLAHLLLTDPLPGLGDEYIVTEVAFQAHRLSPVDDALITGDARDGSKRLFAVAVRRDPVIGVSDEKFASLWKSIVHATQSHLREIADGSWRNGLVVSGPHRPTRELADLAMAAFNSPDSTTFRAAVEAGPAPLKERLRLVDALTANALLGTGASTDDALNLTWSLLAGMEAIEVHLQDPDARDRGTIIGRLASVAGDADGLRLWQALTALASRYVPEGATVNEALLRRDLVGIVAVARSSRLPLVWAVVDELERQAVTQVRGEISYQGRNLALARDALRGSVRDAIVAQPLHVVTGEPDTGKSALVWSAVADLKAQGATVVALNLRDLPSTPGEVVTTLGVGLPALFGSLAVADDRAFVLDGAEAIQEGQHSVFIGLVSAAIAAGVNVTVVGRRDAVPSLQRALGEAIQPNTGLSISTTTIAGFDQDEVGRLRVMFPELEGIAGEPRAAWLLARPGLVDLLLRADAVRGLPTGPLAESDVFVAIWAELVRNREERTRSGAMPDEREHVLLELARRRLIPGSTASPTDGAALASLRSDGLLRRRDGAAPWQPDDFSGDLIRDFSLAGLFDREGFDLVDTATAPRWAIRATRLAVQARLLRALDFDNAWNREQGSFDGLARTYGARWADVPWESLLDPRAVTLLPSLWSSLIANDGAELQRVLRLVRQRPSSLGGSVDPLIAGPVASLLLDRADEWTLLRRQPREDAEKFLTEWLAGLAGRREADRTDEVRVRARALLLGDGLIDDHEERLKALATLGVDLDDAASDALRHAIGDHPHELQDAVEDPYARLSLALRRPALLLELAEAYYIEQVRPGRFGDGGVLEDGVRDHRFLGIGMPMAAPYYGPFGVLLNVAPRDTFAFVNRLLDHAAARRVHVLNDLDREPGRPEDDRGVQLGIGPEPGRLFVGDAHVWGWYRGNTVGPYPAMSALMAIEDWADRVIGGGASIQRVIELLLADAHNLAMAGLVFGLLVRHLDLVTDELDAFLREPVVWHLEFGRVVAENNLLTRPDDESRRGKARRRHSPRDVVTELVFRAVSSGDRSRLDALAEIGRHLDDVAGTLASAEAAASMRQWAASFDPQHYELTEVASGIEIRHVPPQDAEATLAATNADLRRGGDGWRLLNAYVRADGPLDLTTLRADLATARAYREQPPESGPNEVDGPPTAVAMATLQAHGDGRAAVDDDDLIWAISTVVEVMHAAPSYEDVDFGGMVFDLGADRSAGRGLAATLLGPFHEEASTSLRAAAEDPGVEAALLRSLTSPIDEVRRLTAIALRPVWQAACEAVFDGRCRHVVALTAAVDAARFARLGGWDDSARRSPLPLEGSVLEELAAQAPEDLAMDWLTSVAIAASDCAVAANCQSERARVVLGTVLDAQRRMLPRYLEHHYKRDEVDREPFVIATIREAAAGRNDDLQAWLASFSDKPEAVAEFLGDAETAATYDASFRTDLATTWPRLADQLLDAAESGVLEHDRDHLGHDALANVIASPQIRGGEANIDSVLDAARAGWISLDVARPRIERWLPHAVGCGRCVDGLIQFLRTTPIVTQVQEGLPWVRQLVEGRGEGIITRSYFVLDWLTELRDSGLLAGASRASYQVVVDALAAAGSRRAAELQALEE
jgi:hypothetical protein